MKRDQTKGFIQLIFLIIVGVLVLSYFRVDIQSIVESDIAQDNIAYIKELALNIWENYLKGPAVYIWNFLAAIIWQPGSFAMTHFSDIINKAAGK